MTPEEIEQSKREKPELWKAARTFQDRLIEWLDKKPVTSTDSRTSPDSK